MARRSTETVERETMVTLRKVIERSVSGEHLGPMDELTLENALIDTETLEHGLIAPQGLPSDVEDLGEWTRANGVHYHFHWVPDDAEGPYIIVIGTEDRDTFVNYIHKRQERFWTSDDNRIRNYS